MATRVLLIEDEPLLLSLYAMILHQGLYEVVTASDAVSGEEKVIMLRPHVILLDLLIPAGPGAVRPADNYHDPIGFRVLHFVKRTPSLSQIRVIILSNLDSDEHIKRAKALGADQYLIKADLDPHQLGQHVDAVLHGSA